MFKIYLILFSSFYEVYMKRYIIYVVVILLIVAIVFFALLFNDKNSPKSHNETKLDNNERVEKWLSAPTAYVNNCLYIGRGEVLYSVPDGWEYYGTILKKVPRDKFTLEEELCSNVAKFGSKVFLNRNNLDKIYIEFNIDGKIQYNEFRDE